MVPTTMFLTDEAIKSGNIGPGDEVVMTGLFAHFSGEQKNFPIVRTGNIAMLPQGKGEKIPATGLGPTEA